MIAKCVALLAVVAQINAFVCNTGCAGVRGGALGGSTCNARNIVARGKYPVAVENCGPLPDPRVPVTTSSVQSPLQVKPTVSLPANIPCPRTVAHHCTCYKTILRPRVHDQVITVPSVQRYLETTHTPVVENIHYEAVPVNCGCAAVAPILTRCGCGCGCGVATPILSGYGCGCGVRGGLCY